MAKIKIDTTGRKEEEEWKTVEYRITLKSGVVRDVTRDETPSKSVIGLLKWANAYDIDVFVDFNECVIRSKEIAVVDRPTTFLKKEDEE
ncbi:hypothetical protein [Bacillus phage SBSphiJ1]|nr:hypothetical protein [Bacillus phage SBSphiJ1]